MRSYLLILLVAAIVTYLMTPALRVLALRLGAMTAVRDRDVHETPTPRLGGVAMLLGLIAALAVGSYLPFLDPVMSGPAPWGILISAAMMCIVGAIDDVWGLDPITRLAAQGLAGLLLAWQGVQLVSLPVLGVTVGSGGMLLTLSVLAVVGTINAVNFIDGLDGLVAGVMAIGGAAFFIYTYALTRESSPSDYSSLAAVIAAAMVGICLGFLPHNFNPARIFMGDSGAYLIGLLTASATIVVTGQIDPTIVSQARLMPAFAPVLLPIAVLLIPMLDLILAVLRRVQSGRSPFSADRGHLHHRLLDLGHSHRVAVLIMYAWAVVFAFGAVALAFLPMQWSVPLVCVAFVVVLASTAVPFVRKALSRR